MSAREPKILVVGDSCVDRFVYCDCERLCPEAPVPVLDVLRVTENPGMAGNVHRNVKVLNPSCDLITNPNHLNITKTRYVDEKTNHMFVRIDHTENVQPVDLNKVYDLSGEYDVIIISDYCKGFLDEHEIEAIGQAHPLVFLDTKKILGNWAKSVTFIKINRTEYEASKRFIDKDLEGKLITTLGAGGCQYKGKVFPVEEVEIKNLSGSGDVFLAGLVSEYAETGDMNESLCFANVCATKAVQKKGTGYIDE